MIDWLRRTLHLGPDIDDRQRNDALVTRIERAVAESAREDAAVKDEIVRRYPQTDLARAIRDAHRLVEGGRS